MALARFAGLVALLLLVAVEGGWLTNFREAYFGRGMTLWTWRRRRVHPIQRDDAGPPSGYVPEWWLAPLLFKPAGDRVLVRESWGLTYLAYPIALRASAEWDPRNEQVAVRARLCYWPTATALVIGTILPPAPTSGVEWLARIAVLLVVFHISVPLELWRFRRLADALREDDAG